MLYIKIFEILNLCGSITPVLATSVRLNENQTVRLNLNLDELCGQDGNLCGSHYLLKRKWDFDFLFFQKVCGSKISKAKNVAFRQS